MYESVRFGAQLVGGGTLFCIAFYQFQFMALFPILRVTW